MKLGIVKEIHAGEHRVATTPDTVRRLVKGGFEVLIETRAGDSAGFLDDEYLRSDAAVRAKAEEIWAEADVILKVRPPEFNATAGKHEAEMLREGGTLIGFIFPAQNKEALDLLAARRATVLAMDGIPRITRAQKMDALSSMANISGYRAVIEAAERFGRLFTGQITAAGKIPAAKVLIIGAGVAGLAAIGTANGLGAIVRAFDTRPAVRDEVRSMGAEFLELDFKESGEGQGGYGKVMSPEFIKAEMELFAKQAKEVDIIITTAQVPGKRAPVLITEEMVRSMRMGSVIVDLAAEQGGNCALTVPNEIVVRHGVNIIGYTDLPSRLPTQASQLYGTNVFHLLGELGGAENFHVDLENEVIRTALVLNKGELTWPPPPLKSAPIPKPAAGPAEVKPPAPASANGATPVQIAFTLGSVVLLFLIGIYAPAAFVSHFTVFVLACLLGWRVIWSVTPALHTPLMSVTNAISGIIIIGGVLQFIRPELSPTTLLGFLAVLLATVNIAGGFLVTQRMLRMFHK